MEGMVITTATKMIIHKDSKYVSIISNRKNVMGTQHLNEMK